MQDFKVEQDNYGQFDFVLSQDSKTFDSVDGFETAVQFQLFTDKRVSAEDVSNPLGRKGWMGDLESRSEAYQVGSLLHLKEQSRDTQADNNEIASYAKNALDYLVAIGATKEITARVVGKNIEGIITNPANDIARYASLWKGTIIDA